MLSKDALPMVFTPPPSSDNLDSILRFDIDNIRQYNMEHAMFYAIGEFIPSRNNKNYITLTKAGSDYTMAFGLGRMTPENKWESYIGEITPNDLADSTIREGLFGIGYEVWVVHSDCLSPLVQDHKLASKVLTKLGD